MPVLLRGRRGWVAAVAAVCFALVATLLAATPGHANPVQPNTWYVLESRHSGKVMDISGAGTADGAGVVQYGRNDRTNQQFRFLDSGDGWFRVQARHSSKVLDVWDWNASDGAQIVQWTDLNAHNQQFRFVDSGNGWYRLVNRFSGKALDVWEWSTADNARISQFTDLNGVNQHWRVVPVDGGGQQPTDSPVGWASTNGGTNGGAGGRTVTVTTAAQLRDAIANTDPLTIRVGGTISWSGMNRVQSNKTIVGVGGNAVIQGGGFDINATRNVIIRNITFRNWDDDAVNLQNGARNVWIDHNTFTNGYDGAVDIKRESDFVTVSWNRFHNHDKTSLVGHSDGHTADRGHLRVTYHHNWFDGTNTRHPRVRFGNPVHVFNNYYANNSEYGVASTMGAGVLVEGNYFENVRNPTHVGYAASAPGTLVARNNHFVNSGTPETAGGVAAIPYAYTVAPASSIRDAVRAGAGVGRINP